MVWTPSVAFDYPNIGDDLDSQPASLAALDTSANGELGPEDDPYGPYYPGDSLVDWVGLSNNWIPNINNEPNLRNGPPPQGYFEGSINGNAAFLASINSAGTTANLDFYNRYCVVAGKPLILRYITIWYLILVQSELLLKVVLQVIQIYSISPLFGNKCLLEIS